MVNRFGEALQAFNQELIQCMEDLKTTRSKIEAEIKAEEAEKIQLQHEVEKMSNRISQLNESLGKKSAARTDYEHTLHETESAFIKILESSQMLLKTVKKEVICLDQTLGSSNSTDQLSNIDVAKCINMQDSLDFRKENAAFQNLLPKTGDNVKKKKNDKCLILKN